MNDAVVLSVVKVKASVVVSFQELVRLQFSFHQSLFHAAATIGKVMRSSLQRNS